MTGSLTRFKAACVQFCASRSLERNLEMVHRLIGEAVAGGADLVLTPEMTGVIEMNGKVLMANACAEADDPGLAALTAMAAEFGVWLSVGSLVIKLDDGRLANRSFLGVTGRTGGRQVRQDAHVRRCPAERRNLSGVQALRGRATGRSWRICPGGGSACRSVTI